jgi:hypothetical protein
MKFAFVAAMIGFFTSVPASTANATPSDDIANFAGTITENSPLFWRYYAESNRSE